MPDPRDDDDLPAEAPAEPEQEALADEERPNDPTGGAGILTGIAQA